MVTSRQLETAIRYAERQAICTDEVVDRHRIMKVLQLRAGRCFGNSEYREVEDRVREHLSEHV